jgi:Zn-dependent protease/CBS domain-containing protein
MRQTLRLGRIAGIPVGVHWSVLGIMVLLVDGLAMVVLPGSATGFPSSAYWVAALVGTLLFLGSLLAHEMAHAVVAHHYGIGVERVTLWLLGGVAEFSDEPPTAGIDFLVAGVGPLVSFLTGVLFGLLGLGARALSLPTLIVATLAWLAIVNLILAVFNLLPGAPLDGGRVLRAALWRWRKNRDWAALTAARTGYALGIALIGVGVLQSLLTGLLSGVWLLLVGWFLVSAASAERAAARYHDLLSRVPARAIMSTNPVCGHPGQSVDDFVRTVASGSRHRAFPLTDDAGHPTGVVRLRDLGRVPASERARVPVEELATPVSLVPVVEPTQPVGDVAPDLARGALALVVAGDVLVGVMSSDDIVHATELATLTGESGR